MTTTVNTNMQVYDDERRSATVETLMQNTTALNAASNGAITLVQNEMIGHFKRESLFTQTLHNTRRDTVDVGDKVASNMQMGEIVSPKLHRSYMPEMTRDSLRKIGGNTGTFSSAFGRQMAKEKQAHMLNAAILVARSSMSANAAISTVRTTPGALTFTDMVDAQQKFGDASSEIVAWVMHSASYTALMKAGLAMGSLDSVAGVMINNGTVGAIGKPILVTDSPSLLDAANPGNYVVMGLVERGVSVIETEPDDVVSQTVTGQGNLIERIQGEYAFNVEPRGFSWIMASGQNPDDATLAVSANYQQIMTDHKSLGGVYLSTPVV